MKRDYKQENSSKIVGFLIFEEIESRISGFFNLKIPIFSMPQYRDFEIIIFTENYDYLIHFSLSIETIGVLHPSCSLPCWRQVDKSTQ